MIKAVKRESPLVLDNGDIDLYGLQDYLHLPPTKLSPVMYYIPLDYFSLNPWDGAWKAGLDLIQQRIVHICPITCLEYVSWLPQGIITTDPTRYPVPEQFRRMASDRNWTNRYYLNDSSKIDTVLLGTGYSLGILPYDGSGSIVHFSISLDNRDSVLGAGHVWYNK